MTYLSIILAICCVALIIRQCRVTQLDIIRKGENEEIARKNSLLRERQKQLNAEISQQEKEVVNLTASVKQQEGVLKTLTTSAENMRKGAEQQAQQAFEARVSALDAEYDKKQVESEKKYSQALTILNQKVLAEQSKLEELESKQDAYYRAQKRAQEMEAQRDYYRMVLNDDDLADVQTLRQLQISLRRKDSVDKVIYETYYRPAYNTLMSHIFGSNDKVCGIYKITSLITQQAYIGQSTDIKERFRQHIKTSLSSATTPNKLYQEMKKQGPENFTFEILEEVSRDQLNEREVYWIEFYKTKEVGLNSTRGGS